LEKPAAIRLEMKRFWRNLPLLGRKKIFWKSLLLLGRKGKYFGKACCY